MKAEERKEKILEAALRCFLRDGFHKASMDSIAREAGISPALIYRHFKSKVDLIQHLVETSQDQGRRNFDAALEEKSLFGSLEKLFASDLKDEAMWDLVPLSSEIYAEAHRDPDVGALLKKDLVHHVKGMGDLVSRAQTRGEVDPRLPACGIGLVLTVFTQGFISTMSMLGRKDCFTDPALSGLFRLAYAKILGMEGPPLDHLINDLERHSKSTGGACAPFLQEES